MRFHGAALADLLSQILAVLQEEGVDAIAAVYSALSFNSQPVNAGPFMCEPGCFAPGESLTLTAFPDYHAGVPATETIVMPIITDEIQIGNAIQAGQVDWHSFGPVGRIQRSLRATLTSSSPSIRTFGYFSLQYNLPGGPAVR